MEDDVTLEYERNLRMERGKDAASEEKEQETEGDSSEEENKDGGAALNIMTWFDVAGDLLGWIPFVGGIVRLITGVGAVIQSFKLNINVRVRAWVINGIMALINILLSFIGLNILPTQTIGAFIIRAMAKNATQKKDE